jgi:phosphate starvation-inducible PhoH-like protein
MDIHLSEGKRDKNSLENKGILTGCSNRKNSVITQLAPYSLEDCSFLGQRSVASLGVRSTQELASDGRPTQLLTLKGALRLEPAKLVPSCFAHPEEFGEPKQIPQEKKKPRRSKKQTEKELLQDYYNDNENHSFVNKKKIYENMQYLSPNEKAVFENKFTKPINLNQEEYVTTLKNKNKKIIIVSGPAGTGKTLFATEFGVKNFLLGTYEKLIFTRPSVSVDEDLGFLPGTLEDKMAPWIRPIYDILHNFITPKEVQTMMEEKTIEVAPLGYMRGRTFKNCWIVADEMQNSSISQMKMLLTRLGENSRLIITGDLEQYDRPTEVNGLEDFLNKFRGKRSSSISSFEFDKGDIQREQVVREILDIYSSHVVPNGYTDDISLTSSSPTSSIEGFTAPLASIKSSPELVSSEDEVIKTVSNDK